MPNANTSLCLVKGDLQSDAVGSKSKCGDLGDNSGLSRLGADSFRGTSNSGAKNALLERMEEAAGRTPAFATLMDQIFCSILKRTLQQQKSECTTD